MAKTITLEELTPDTRKVLEELFSADEPIILSRNGQPVGGVIAYRMQEANEVALTPEDEAELRAAVAQGEADYAAGKFLTLEEFKTKHMAKLGGTEE
ncbi:MAG TPA: hypothetical protein VKU00_09165 [Chthonomonadaceae bacterium]|nr:hypothetical protein [Chthonomonadaceae bacterium]